MAALVGKKEYYEQLMPDRPTKKAWYAPAKSNLFQATEKMPRREEEERKSR